MSDDFLSSVDDVSGSVLPTFKPVAIQENTTLGYVNGHTLRTVFPGKTTYTIVYSLTLTGLWSVLAIPASFSSLCVVVVVSHEHSFRS